MTLISHALMGCMSGEIPSEPEAEVAHQQPVMEPTSEIPQDTREEPPAQEPLALNWPLDRSVEGPLAIPDHLRLRWRQLQHQGGDRTLLMGQGEGINWPTLGDRLLTMAEDLPGHGITPQLITPGLIEDLTLLRLELLTWGEWTGDRETDKGHMERMVDAEHGLVRLWLELARLLDATRPMPGEAVERDEERLLDALAIWDGDPQLTALLTPPLVAYDRMSSALVRYQGIQDSGGFKELPGYKAFKRARPKRKHKSLPLLRERLAQEDLGGAGEGEIWDEELTAALKRARIAFQLPPRRGKKLLDEKLFKALSTPVSPRLRSLERNLTRLRTSELQDQPYAIYVNLPDFHGEVWDGPDRLHRFKVVIGNRKKDEG
ncbi:MAG: hypothetical protein VX938_10860, partial [Myxococcota bacterium]|nr:hypothetical protein [Myxococcota bacterium]